MNRSCVAFSCFSSKQRDLYDESFRDLVQAVLDGFNGTIFAYGQTGTGKTFTMQGTVPKFKGRGENEKGKTKTNKMNVKSSEMQ